MEQMLITADIHGYYSSWQTIKNLLDQKTTLVIAGDLFDTKYGNPTYHDFQPDKIKEEFKALPNKKHFVYGNCDK